MGMALSGRHINATTLKVLAYKPRAWYDDLSDESLLKIIEQ